MFGGFPLVFSLGKIKLNSLKGEISFNVAKVNTEFALDKVRYG